MGETRRRGRRRLWIALGVSTVLCGLPVGFVVWTAASFERAGEPQPVDCAEAMAWAGATLPKSAEGARCSGTSWLDTHLSAEFRMPRDEVAGWLAGTWPSGEQRTEFCAGDADLCVAVEREQLPPDPAGPAAVNVRVRWEGADTAFVDVSAFTV
ncbi:hypothetical protein [Streptomyces tritici]|uniref:hypothetical protein n=1 Tax=Streptomyces tritici TaxID=2054410 RepID=UPI003AF052A4